MPPGLLPIADLARRGTGWETWTVAYDREAAEFVIIHRTRQRRDDGSPLVTVHPVRAYRGRALRDEARTIIDTVILRGMPRPPEPAVDPDPVGNA